MLYKNLLRNLIVRLGIEGVIRPRWTEQIHREWIRNLLDHRPDLSRERLERTRALMDRAIPECLVTYVPATRHALPDPDDQHVLAGAIASEAQLLLTCNLADFPDYALPKTLQAVHPDQFLLACLEQQNSAVLTTIHKLRASLKSPPFTALELIAALARDEIPEFAAKLRDWADRI